MPLKNFNPITPSTRFKVLPSFEEITKTSRRRACRALKRSGGRNNTGRITCRHIGGGHKRHYRLVDFKRRKTRRARHRHRRSNTIRTAPAASR